MAYCLVGLFGVHIAPLYVEGHNAFIRLQLEILSKVTTSLSSPRLVDIVTKEDY
jgi:hypothetical protein